MRVGNDTTIKARARIESESIGVAADTLPITREEARLLWQRAQEAQAHDKGPTNLRLWAKRASIVLKTGTPANRAVLARSHPLLDGDTLQVVESAPVQERVP